MSFGYNNLKKSPLIVIANPAGSLGRCVKRSPARETIPKSMRCIARKGWLRSTCISITSLPMTYFCSFVIANPVSWLRQGVKRSPARGTKTGSIRSCTRGRQLHNPPTNHASLPMPPLFLSSLRTQRWFVGKTVKQSPTRETIPKSMRCISWRGWRRSPCTGIASLATTIRFYFFISTPSIFAKMVPLA